MDKKVFLEIQTNLSFIFLKWNAQLHSCSFSNASTVFFNVYYEEGDVSAPSLLFNTYDQPPCTTV